MKRLLSIFLCLLPILAAGQEPAMQWLKVIGGDGTDLVMTPVTRTNDGGFIFSYESSSTSGPIDTLCNATYVRSIFEKYNADASILEWTKCYLNQTGDSAFLYMFSTTDSGYVLCGIGNKHTHTFLIHKEDAAGNVLWSKSYGDSAEVNFRSMTVSDKGGYIMVGELTYTNIDFPIHYGGFMNADVGVIKVDSNGNKIWSKVVGGSGDERVWAVVSGPNGGCYVIGTTPSNDYDCAGNHGGGSGSTDGYVIRLDGNSNVVWHKDIGGTGYDQGNNGCADNKGGVIVGATSRSNDGDVTHHIGIGGSNLWAVDIDSNGNIVWNNCYGGGSEFTNSICRASDGSIWIAGTSAGKGGEVDTAYGNWDAYFVHADSIGGFLSAKVLGSNSQDEALMIFPLDNGNVIGGGYYDNAGGAFPNIWNGSHDAFLTVFAPWSTATQQITPQNTTLKIYPNPANETITIETNSRGTIIISDVLGRVIHTTAISGTSQIEVKGWQRGLYYVQMITEDGNRSVQKLIVE
jgi:hypothetical protein